MTKTTAAPAAEPAHAPSYPNAAIDFNAMMANEALGKTGDALLEGAILDTPQTEAAAKDEPVASAAAKSIKPDAG